MYECMEYLLSELSKFTEGTFEANSKHAEEAIRLASSVQPSPTYELLAALAMSSSRTLIADEQERLDRHLTH